MVSGITDVLATNNSTDNLSNVFQNDLGKEEFLNLLVAQLQNQDPLNPMESQEFSSQLAQFSSVEQLTSINDNIEQSIGTDLVLSQTINNTLATALIGKEVTAVGNRVELGETGQSKVNFNLGEFASNVTIKIFDAANNEVRKLDGSNMASGNRSLEWDGLDEYGEKLGEGIYTFEVSATDNDGNTISSKELIRGFAGALQYSDGGALLKVGQLSISFGDVLEISSGFGGAE